MLGLLLTFEYATARTASSEAYLLHQLRPCAAGVISILRHILQQKASVLITKDVKTLLDAAPSRMGTDL